MTEAGTFADRVKQQADIVRVIGEYVRLKKGGANFTGLCPFHNEKTPSFAVHPVKKIYHCFGCGVGGDVFKFVMEMEKLEFLDAVRVVAEKCGIAVPPRKPRSPEERREESQKKILLELHRDADEFFQRQLKNSPEGAVALGYLEDRGLDRATIEAFGLGFAPSGGDALLRHVRGKYAEKLVEASGLVSRDGSGRLYDRFRRRIIFPIANEGGRVVAFGGRALGEEPPKYLNSPETPIYTKSGILYHFDRAKEAIRQQGFAVMVEGYMDAIAVARAGVTNVVASCGTSLTEMQLRLLGRFTRRVVMNYDPDTAGQTATERSLTLLLEQSFDARVLRLPGGADPDQFIKQHGAAAYQKLLAEAPAFLDHLIERALSTGGMDVNTAEGKLRAVNFLLPYLQKLPDRILRSEWASRVAQRLRIDEPMLRETLRRAAAERRSEVKIRPGLAPHAAKPAERRLIQLLAEGEGFRQRLAAELRELGVHRGLSTEKLFEAMIEACAAGERPDPMVVGELLDPAERRLLYDILFEAAAEPTWDEASSCLIALRRVRLETELADLQRRIEAGPAPEDLGALLARKTEIRRELSGESQG
ncbi:MAG TPA: DNA primase [Candidatus Acidoferrales bacterium]|nr:DNA primase [Candidatus Acidoferrales bacterium]